MGSGRDEGAESLGTGALRDREASIPLEGKTVHNFFYLMTAFIRSKHLMAFFLFF